MAHKVIDRCKESTSTAGTGPFTLAGPISGYVGVTSTDGLADDLDTSFFCAEAGAQWEIFLGTRTDSSTLARTTVISSSNGGATVNFSSPPVVFSTVPAARILPRMFKVFRGGSNQSVSTGAYTKVQLNAEEIDSHGEFDSTTNFRWTPLVPGWYLVSYKVFGFGTGASVVFAVLHKNGSRIGFSSYAAPLSGESIAVGTEIVYMNGTTDYLELFAFVNGTSPIVKFGVDGTSMSGVLMAAMG